MKMHGRMVQFSSYIPPEMYAQLKKINKKTKIPMACLIREALEKVIARYSTVKFGNGR